MCKTEENHPYKILQGFFLGISLMCAEIDRNTSMMLLLSFKQICLQEQLLSHHSSFQFKLHAETSIFLQVTLKFCCLTENLLGRHMYITAIAFVENHYLKKLYHKLLLILRTSPPITSSPSYRPEIHPIISQPDVCPHLGLDFLVLNSFYHKCKNNEKPISIDMCNGFLFQL